MKFYRFMLFCMLAILACFYLGKANEAHSEYTASQPTTEEIREVYKGYARNNTTVSSANIARGNPASPAIKKVVYVEKIPKGVEEFARRTAREYGIPEEIFIRQLKTESGMRPHAKGAAGELGVGQVMQYNIIPNYKKNYRVQVEMSAGIMRRNFVRYKSWDKALMAYNCGRAKNIPASTKRYVKKIIGK